MTNMREKFFKDQAWQAQSKKLIIFDLDGTLTESKAAIDPEMALFIGELLTRKLVAVIGGGAYTQFQNQLLSGLKIDEKLFSNLYLFPTSGASFYQWKSGDWIQQYEHILSSQEQKKIMEAFENVLKKIGYSYPITTYGEIIENRSTQVTFSALGQKAPLKKKEEWNANSDCRQELKAMLEKLLPKFEVRLGGLTSIDVTKKGIDKAFGVRQIMKIFNITIESMIFIGDALYEGGNDHAVKNTSIDTVEVSGPEETKKFIKNLLNLV